MDDEYEYIYVEVFADEGRQKLIDYYTSGNPRQPRRYAYEIIMDGANAACPGFTPTHGACGAIGRLVKLPDEKVLFGLEYKGDIGGWRKRFTAFCRATHRTYAIRRGSVLIIWPGDVEIPVAECEVISFAQRAGHRRGYDPPTETLPREPKWEANKPVARLANELLERTESTPIELVEIFQFQGDSADQEAHDDDLQDLLERRFITDFNRMKGELIDEFGEPRQLGDSAAESIPLCGVFRSALWSVDNKTLYLGAAHEDRELPFLLVIGTAALQ